MANPPRNGASHRVMRFAWLACAIALLHTGCATTEVRHAAPPDNAARLDLGRRHFDTLTCESTRCSAWYRVPVHRAQRISVEVLGVDGQDAVDFEVAFYSRSLEVLDEDTAAWKRPRRLSTTLESGLYYVRVLSEGPLDHALDLQLRAIAGPVTSFDVSPTPPHVVPKINAPATQTLEQNQTRLSPTPLKPTAAPPKARPAPRSTRKPSPTTPAALPSEPWIRSPVIEVERANGKPFAVLIDAGTATGLVDGQAGRMVRRGRVIGKVVVIDVYPTGSRAMIISEIVGDITSDTVVEVLAPPNR